MKFVFSFALDIFTCLKLQKAVKGKYVVKSFLYLSLTYPLSSTKTQGWKMKNNKQN